MCGTLFGMTTSFDAGGFIPADARNLIVGVGGPDCILPLPVGEKPLRIDFPKSISRVSGVQSPFDDGLLREVVNDLVRKQIAYEATLPVAPEGYHWETVTEWPGIDDDVYSFKVTMRYVLRADDGSDA